MGTASHYGTASAPPFAVQLAEVEVDVETGQVTVKKLVTAIDCGVPINPITASGQVEGAMLQSLGYALTEDLVLDASGKLVNDRFGPYWISGRTTPPSVRRSSCKRWSPRARSAPRLVGEVPMDGIAPAVRNAVLNATGVKVNHSRCYPSESGEPLNNVPTSG